jgi:hypothetical protein
MGGNAFKGPNDEPLSASIKREEVRPTVAYVVEIIADVGDLDVELLGSSGKKEMSGDIDLAVGPIPADVPAKQFKDTLLKICAAALGTEHARLVGQNIALNVPIRTDDPEREGLRVQIDLMLSSNPEQTAWLMAGTAGGPTEVKGVYRNLLLAYIAKKRGEMTGQKITISYPGGIQVLRDGEVVVPRTEDPGTIISTLGLSGTPADLLTFDSVFDAAQGLIDLDGFAAYIEPTVKRDPEEGMKAMDALNRKMTGPGMLREMIRNMLRYI